MRFSLGHFIFLCFFQLLFVISFSQQAAISYSNEVKHVNSSPENVRDSILSMNLIQVIDSVLSRDQFYRTSEIKVREKYGYNSKELSDLRKAMRNIDITNLAIVNKLIEKYGWSNIALTGKQGLSTIFIVIQHSDLITQEKYLPVIKKAVSNGDLSSADLALLEDRIAIQHGKKQIYGSQVGIDFSTGKYFILPIEDEINVNNRRFSIGLGTLEEYSKFFNIDYKLPRFNDSTESIFTSDNILILIVILFILFISICVLLFKKMKLSTWYWFYIVMTLFLFYSIYLDTTSTYSLLRIYKMNWILYLILELIIKSLTIYCLKIIFFLFFKRNFVFFDIFAIFLGFLSSFFLSKHVSQEILLSNSNLVFLFKIIEPIFYIGVFSILHFTFLLVKRKKQIQL